MQHALRGILFGAVALFAQGPVNPPGQPAPAPPGLETTWEIAPVLTAIGDHSSRVASMLDQIDPNDWVNKGASPTYAEQLQTCKEQVKAVAQTARDLARSPERLAPSLELLIRIEGLDTLYFSVEEAIRKYQGPSHAQELVSLIASGSADRERFQQYLVSLAAEREHALEVMDKEAQRCRAQLTLPSPSASKTGKKK